MKKTIMTIALVMGITLALKSQTTQAEYQYATLGYKNQVINEGGDVKKGYAVAKLFETSSDKRNVKIAGLYRLQYSIDKPVALIILYKKDGGDTEYLCAPMPESDESLHDAFRKSLYDGSGDASTKLKIISFALSQTFFKIINK